jgi:heme/copper-type cytochrome/quinol oxidase subunit 2
MIVPVPLHMHLSFAATAVGLFWTSVACCAVAQFFILRSVGGARHAPEPTAHLPRQRGGVEMLWAVVPALALAVVLAFTWRAIRAGAPGEPVRESAVEVAR